MSIDGSAFIRIMSMRTAKAGTVFEKEGIYKTLVKSVLIGDYFQVPFYQEKQSSLDRTHHRKMSVMMTIVKALTTT